MFLLTIEFIKRQKKQDILKKSRKNSLLFMIVFFSRDFLVSISFNTYLSL